MGFFNIKRTDIPPKIEKLLKKMEKNSKIIKKKISDITSDSDFTVKVLLDQIQKFDSFNINFIKFLIRLKLLFETGKRNKKTIFSLKSEVTRRDILRDALNNNFFNEFEDLRRFLLNYLNQLKKLRNICSHRTPKHKFSKNKKYALIYNPIKNNLIGIHVEKTKKFVLTYAYFIEALGF